MKYIITEEQLKRITEEESTENKGRIVYVDVKLPDPNELKITRETHPELFKTKYTSDGHPIPLRMIKPTSVKLVAPDGYIYAVHWGDQENRRIAGYESPDKKYYVFSMRRDDTLLEIPSSLIIDVIKSPDDYPAFVDNFYEVYKNGNFSKEKMKILYVDSNGREMSQSF